MIQNEQERAIVEGQLRELEKRLEKVEQSQPYPNQQYSRASLKKMISRLHEELAQSGQDAQTLEPIVVMTRGVK